MFRAIRERLNWQSGKSRLAMAAAICAAGLAIGFGGSALLAQLNEGNPVPNEESQVQYCVYYTYQPVPGCDLYYTCAITNDDGKTQVWYYEINCQTGGCPPRYLVCNQWMDPLYPNGDCGNECPAFILP